MIRHAFTPMSRPVVGRPALGSKPSNFILFLRTVADYEEINGTLELSSKSIQNLKPKKTKYNKDKEANPPFSNI